ncbi:MAG: arylesterase [Syntrophotaleaceae bacterium]
MPIPPLPLLLANLCPAPGPASAKADRPIRILAFGDSLVAGFAVPSKAAFPVRLEKALRAMNFPVELVNAGVPGDTTLGARGRLSQALACRPDLVIVELGANDNLQGFDPALTESNLDWIISEIIRQGRGVLLAGIRPLRDLGPKDSIAFEGLFRSLAVKHRIPLYPDFLEGVAGSPALNKADGIHPNPKGIDEIVRRIAPLVAETLRQLPEPLDRS